MEFICEFFINKKINYGFSGMKASTDRPLHFSIKMEDFNGLLQAGLDKKQSKRELLKHLDAAKTAFKAQINSTKDLDILFQLETWQLFFSTASSIDCNGRNDGDLKKTLLEMTQLFTLIVPKGIERRIIY